MTWRRVIKRLLRKAALCVFIPIAAIYDVWQVLGWMLNIPTSILRFLQTATFLFVFSGFARAWTDLGSTPGGNQVDGFEGANVSSSASQHSTQIVLLRTTVVVEDSLISAMIALGQSIIALTVACGVLVMRLGGLLVAYPVSVSMLLILSHMASAFL